jgi:phosphomethylpyrimidine synthase
MRTDNNASTANSLGNKRRRKNRVQLGGGEPTALGLLSGITPGRTTVSKETAKAEVAVRYGVKTITDLTTNGDGALLRALLELDVAVGTVPIYGAVAVSRNTASLASTLFDRIADSVAQGVDFFSVHASLTPAMLKNLTHTDRAIPITSRGGALLADVMLRHGTDNPFLTFFDELVHLCSENSVALSFVASLRPGSIGDIDSPEYSDELQLIASLATAATNAGVATMVELVNHVPLHFIPRHIEVGRKLFPQSALGALGPSPTDIAVGLDDVAGAIGAAVASSSGIDWINLITAGEHSHLPSIEETARALRYFQLALHIGSLSRPETGAQDRALSLARASNNWKVMANYAVDPQLALELYNQHGNAEGKACSMCGSTCPLVRAHRWSQGAPETVMPTGQEDR